MEITHIKGNTFYMETRDSYIPLYKINKREVILLDSGRPRRERAKIYETLEANQLQVRGILCTHAHIDHIGNNTFFKEKYGAQVAMPESEAQFCNSLLGLKSFNYIKNLKYIERNLGDMVCKTDISIKDDQEEIIFCNIPFRIVHTPGHSAGHICLITPDEVAYLGDLLLDTKVLNRSKLPYSYCIFMDLQSKNKLYHLEAAKYVVAHKGLYDTINPLVEENITQLRKISSQILDMCIEGRTFHELIHQVAQHFCIRIDSLMRYQVVERNLKPYLDYLLDIHKVTMEYDLGNLYYKKRQ